MLYVHHSSLDHRCKLPPSRHSAKSQIEVSLPPSPHSDRRITRTWAARQDKGQSGWPHQQRNIHRDGNRGATWREGEREERTTASRPHAPATRLPFPSLSFRLAYWLGCEIQGSNRPARHATRRGRLDPFDGLGLVASSSSSFPFPSWRIDPASPASSCSAPIGSGWGSRRGSASHRFCKMETLRDLALPPGFGFHPKDTELISHYLKKKISGQNIEFDVIPEVDIYKHEPWDLPAKCNLPIQDNKWHFFASRDRKYPNGSRSNRATIAGYWKSTGKDRTIKMSNRTVGTKKTLVFHEGRPPSGRRTQWIMHEYYIDENECQACPDTKDAFVLCRVTKRDGWTSEKDTEVDNSGPHPQQPNDAATSVISTEQPASAVASIIGAEQPNHVATSVTSADISAATADIATPNGDDELQAWLKELFDPSFNPAYDPVSADLYLAEQSAESSNLQNLYAVAPKVELDHASPNQNVADDTDYLLTEDIYNILCPGIDDFNHGVLQDPADQAALAFANQTYMGMDAYTLPNNIVGGAQKEELQLPQKNNEPYMSNEAVDTGIIVRRRRATTPATSMSPSSGKVRLQVGINRMVTSNSESINQTIKFADNSSRLDLMTNIEHQKKHAHDATSVKQSDAGKSSKDHNNQGFFRGVQKAFRGCSAAGLNILVAVCMIGVAAAVVLHHGRHRPGVSL